MKKGISAKSVFTKKNIIMAAVFVVMAAAIVFLVIKLIDHGKTTDERPTLVTPANAQQVRENVDKPVQDGSYEVMMNTKWNFDGKNSDAYVENSTNNTRTVYFDVFLADTNKLVYSSPYIPVGQRIQGFPLDDKPEPGSYKGLVTYHLVDDGHKEVSNLSVTVDINVK